MPNWTTASFLRTTIKLFVMLCEIVTDRSQESCFYKCSWPPQTRSNPSDIILF